MTESEISLLGIPKPPLSRVPVVVASTTHTALTVYNRVLPDDLLTPVLRDVAQAFGALTEELQSALLQESQEGGYP